VPARAEPARGIRRRPAATARGAPARAARPEFASDAARPSRHGFRRGRGARGPAPLRLSPSARVAARPVTAPPGFRGAERAAPPGAVAIPPAVRPDGHGFNSNDHRNWFDPGNDCQKVVNIASSDDSAELDDPRRSGSRQPAPGARRGKWSARCALATGYPRRPGALERSRTAPRPPAPARSAGGYRRRAGPCDGRTRARSHRHGRKARRDTLTASRARVCRSPLATRAGCGRSRFAATGPSEAPWEALPAPRPGPSGRASQKYREEQFGVSCCQPRRAWLLLPKSGLHGFRQRRYR
jgi:hypothetical protein